jgi:hypothetical protein
MELYFMAIEQKMIALFNFSNILDALKSKEKKPAKKTKARYRYKSR